jgi:drug/metabolite transporter (DMT)-like permease
MPAPAAAASSTAHDNVRGIVAMLVAVGTFAFMDAGLKVLAPHYPALQVVALRGLASLPIVLAWALVAGGGRQLLRVRWSLHLARGALGIAMLAAFAFALRQLPLSEAYSIFFVAPLLITALAGPLLGERVGRARWIAIGVGLAGVAIVLRPTGAGVVSLAGAAMLGCAAAYALSSVLVRLLGRTDSTLSMVFWLVVMFAVGATALAWPAWRPVETAHYGVLAGVAISGALGQFAVTEAFRRGEASVIAPLEYTALAWGAGLDWWLWSTAPAPHVLAGAAVIVACGIYLIRTERKA